MLSIYPKFMVRKIFMCIIVELPAMNLTFRHYILRNVTE
jgi:hypothetical protein